jgi:hypothetical protein
LVYLADLLVRVFLILPRAEAAISAHRVFVLQLAQQSCKGLSVVPIRNGLQNGLNGLRSELVRQIDIHTYGKVVAVLLLQWRLRRVGCRLELGVEQVVVVLGEFIEATPANLVRRNRIFLSPVTAGVLIEVHTGIDRRIDRRKVKTNGFFGADFGPETSSAIAAEEIMPAASSNIATVDFDEITFMAIPKRNTNRTDCSRLEPVVAQRQTLRFQEQERFLSGLAVYFADHKTPGASGFSASNWPDQNILR